MNFMSNAVKFTAEGGVTLSINTLQQADDKVTVRTVRDTGIGIDKQRKQYSNPFAQEDDSTTRQFGGTGLESCYQYPTCRAYGRTIQLDSVKGEAVVLFDLELPVDSALPKPSTASSEHLYSWACQLAFRAYR
ncbi:ATP-binding protein [Vibrio chagasii]|nr:ATP-binding protein [Vibrio chagasii]